MNYFLILGFAILASTNIAAQKPYVSIFSDNLSANKIQFGKDTICYSNRDDYFRYASQLMIPEDMDSFKKAGRIFDRIYRIDTASSLGINALSRRVSLELKIINTTDQFLTGIWMEKCCVPSDGYGNYTTFKEKPAGKLNITKDEMTFYNKEEIAGKCLYKKRYFFNWDVGFVTVVLDCKNINTSWMVSFSSGFPKMNSGNFFMEKAGLYGANPTICYTKSPD